LLENGFAEVLIQRPELKDEHFDSVFWVMLALGATEGVVLWTATPLFSRLFSEPQLNDIMPLMAIALPCTGVAACFRAMLRRRLQFRQLAARSMFAYGLAFVVAATMAALDYGIYSLVGFFLVSRVLDAVFVVAVSGLRPGTRVTREALRQIVDYGKHRIATQITAYLSRHCDRLVIGIFLGPTVLGLYAIAERLIGMMNRGVTGIVERVAFPVLASRQTDPRVFDRTMREFLTMVNLLSLPIYAGLALTSYGLIEVMFTSAWAPAAPLMQILCFAGLGGPSNFILGSAINALGRPDLVLRYTLKMLVLRVAVSLGAAQIGVMAVAIGRTTVGLMGLPIFLWTSKELFGGKLLRLFGGVWAPVLATAVMAAAVLAISPMLSDSSVVVVLAAQVGVGVAVYVVAIVLLAPKLCMKLIQTIKPR
jgi:O-antigen/teichoic acid export membrane protein